MGVRKTFRRLLNRKSVDLSLTEVARFFSWLGVDPDQKAKALNEATYFACLRLLSESVGKLPLKLLRFNENSGIVSCRGDPRYYILGTRPNPYQTATTFWTAVEANRSHYGNAYVLIHGAGAKMTLWILPSERVTIVNDDKDLFKRGAGKIYYVYSGTDGTYTFGDEEIMHFRTSSTFDGITGVSVRDRLKSTIQGNIDAQKMLNRMYKNGYTGKAVLQYTGDINDDLVKTYIKGIEAYAKGKALDEDGNEISTIIPIPVGSQLTPLNVKLSDGQFLEIKRYSALQIAAAFGVKPSQINDLEKSSYSSGEQQQLAFYVETLLWILKQYEEEISYKLLSAQESKDGMFWKFNIDAVLRADFATKVDTLAKAVNNFLMTPDEARERLDLGNMPGGNRLLGQGANIFLEQIGAQYGAGQSASKNLVDAVVKMVMEACIAEQLKD